METMPNPNQSVIIIPSIPMSKELPKDVIIDILSRLPVRYILRFKSVSKTWYALFQNPNFIAKHFRNQKANSDLDASFLFTPYNTSSDGTSNRNVGLLLSESDKSIKIPIGLDIPFLTVSKPLRVSGSINGLVCLSILPIASIILLWNPATRVFKDLPVSTIDRPKAGPIKVVLGFGFDEATNDYKVLRIVYYGYPLNQVEIYSMTTNSWKEIKTRVQFLIFEASCSVFLNGKFHWTAIGFEEMHGKKLIVCFDIRREAFNYIMPPEFDFSDCDGESKTSWTVAGMKESLAVIGSSGNGSGKRFEVWVMKEYGVVSSWTKYRSFELQTKVGRPLGCGLKGEFLLEKDNNQLILYDPDSQSIKNLGNHGVAYWSDVFNHVGSLLPIKGGKIAERTNLSAVVPDIFFVRKMDLTIHYIQHHDKRIKQASNSLRKRKESIPNIERTCNMNSRTNNMLNMGYWPQHIYQVYDDSYDRIYVSSISLVPRPTPAVVGPMGPSGFIQDRAYIMPAFTRATSQPGMENYPRPRFSHQSPRPTNPTSTDNGVEKLRREVYKPRVERLSQYDYNSQESRNNEDGKRCAVCLDDFEPREMVTLTPCDHMFHENCIVPWVKSRGQCPVCRFVITKERGVGRTNNNEAFEREFMSFIRAMEARG